MASYREKVFGSFKKKNSEASLKAQFCAIKAKGYALKTKTKEGKNFEEVLTEHMKTMENSRKRLINLLTVYSINLQRMRNFLFTTFNVIKKTGIKTKKQDF